MYWIMYQAEKSKPEYRLVLALGNHNGMLCCLDSKIDENSRQFIRENRNIIDGMDLENKLTYIKNHCSEAMKSYKTIKDENYNIVQRYTIG